MGQIFFTQNPTCPREERDSALALTGGLAWEGRGGGTPAAASLGAAPGILQSQPEMWGGVSPPPPLSQDGGGFTPESEPPPRLSRAEGAARGGPPGPAGGDAAWSPRVAPGGVGSRRPGLGPGGW